ncbi:FmdB family transcriptional regulator [Paraburkholderia sp. NMBU_R16]|uniref:FmdB family transcriptional regulator n=1 Tax=Paraburkholderia sp. NMBU_R16 TaxID=2698676 RepID=UPI0015634585|nr:FmdB family transcriptional regulator [Paraburkholderia sp. NMBU_R16]NRO96440.1 FmdB family transcriptional regulator [Paraburkholderia sp. NMBU_R16]
MSVINGRVEGTAPTSFNHEGPVDASSLKKTEALLATVEAQLQSMLRQMSPNQAGGDEGHHGAHHRHSHPNHADREHEAPNKLDTPNRFEAHDTNQGAPKTARSASLDGSLPSSKPASGTPSTRLVTDTTSVAQAQATVHPKFMPVLRGDEKQKDAQIKNQADFGRAVDETAKEYGLDPNVFRAQLQVESGAFSQGYQKALHQEGDLDRAADNNTSVGLGQISRKYLDGREWANGGPGNARVGSQVVTFDQYKDSPTIQLRMAASNLAQRIADHGGLEQGLSYYVSGNDNPNNPSGASYIAKIDAALKDPAVLSPGR